MLSQADTRPAAGPMNGAAGAAFAQAVLEATTDAIVAVDAAGVIRSFNRAAEHVFGWSALEVIGQPVLTLVPRPDQRRRGDGTVREGTIEGRGMSSVGMRKDGGRFPMELTVTSFAVESTRHMAWFVRDVTERTHLEAQLRQSQKMDAMGQLAAGVAHDFNNLLTVINGWCEALSSDGVDDRRSAIDQISDAAARAATLTAQLLTFGRRADVSPRVVDLNIVVEDISKMLGRVIGEDVSLDIRPDARAQFVRVDTGQTSQVLVNLAVNARDAMPKGGRLTIETGPCVLTAAEAHAHGMEPGVYVLLQVSDTGIGMSPEVASRVFEPFFTTKGAKGSGLGLATVYGIVRQAGGAVSVRSRPGEGSVFSIWLPVVAEERAAVETPQTAELERGSETILVVEDEPQVRAIAVNMLRARGYCVLVAASGEEALQLARAQKSVDLVVSDVVMPKESGPDLVARLRCEHKSLPALFVSGYAPDVLTDAVAPGAAFLQKPYTGRQLALRVRQILDGRSSATSGWPPPTESATSAGSLPS